MTEKDKKLEEKVFDQEVSHDELKSVSGGDCGKTAFTNGPCPKGALFIQICPNNTTYGNLQEIPKPVITEPLFEEVEIKLDEGE